VGENGKKAPVILIVEDETLIRWGAVKMAEDAGFEVLEAADADEAIKILENRNDIQVVFTDIHMRYRWPPIKIIVTSGRQLPIEHDIPEGGRFFPKPYSPFQIQSVLREWAQ
jgi:DNA-binding LytR/AlgR family response regulator